MKNTILRECMRIAENENPDHPEWGHFHHFSFVVSRNTMVEWATNRAAPPLIKYGYFSYGKRHSETEAYRKARGLLKGESFEIVNIRLNRQGEVRMSKPCNCCYNFLSEVGCTNVWFTTETNWAKVNLR